MGHETERTNTMTMRTRAAAAAMMRTRAVAVVTMRTRVAAAAAAMMRTRAAVTMRTRVAAAAVVTMRTKGWRSEKSRVSMYRRCSTKGFQYIRPFTPVSAHRILSSVSSARFPADLRVGQRQEEQQSATPILSIFLAPSVFAVKPTIT